MIQITSLYIYPVKSLAAIELKQSSIVNGGLALDRQWLITDSNHQFLTQRQIPAMATIKVAIDEKHLILKNDSQPPLHLPLDQQGKSMATQVWDDNCAGIDQGKEASLWLTQALGAWRDKELLLLKYSASHARITEQSGRYRSFADGYPVLICNKQSLVQLNQHLTQDKCQPVPMTRFRPNIVIDGLPAFAENTLDTIKHHDGNYLVTFDKPCERCKVTTTDQCTGKIENPQQPLKALIELKAQMDLSINFTKQSAFFGQNASLLADNPRIAIGDILQL